VAEFDIGNISALGTENSYLPPLSLDIITADPSNHSRLAGHPIALCSGFVRLGKHNIDVAIFDTAPDAVPQEGLIILAVDPLLVLLN
jgi:hypothetical protein